DEEAWDKLGPEARRSFASVYWARGDPLYLTPWNEYRAEHQARVALAELLFGEPMTDLRGWETDRGLILIRYGLPAVEWQVVRDDRRILTGMKAGYVQCLLETNFNYSVC